LSFELASKTGQRVLKACQATKKVLSTIPQGVVHVELDERDVQINVTRAEMAALCASKLEPVQAMLEELLEHVETVDSVEIIGGGSCIPMFQECIQECLKKQETKVADSTLRKTLDLSTTCVCGAALLARALHMGAFSSAKEVDEATAWDSGLDASNALQGDSLVAMREFEQQVQESEAKFLKYESSRNKFESMIYEMRARSSGAYSKELPSDKLHPILDTQEEWFWGDGADAQLEELESRFEAVEAEIRDTFPAYHEKLQQEAEEEKLAQEKAAAEYAAHQAAEQAEMEANGVVRDTRKLPFAERMKMVMKNKDEGTELFKGGNLEPAAIRYTKALNHAELIKDPSDDEREEVRKVKLSLYLNLAMCFSKLKKFIKAIDNCRYALEIDPDNAKALFRRASAYTEEKDYDKAMVDLEKANSLPNVDPAVVKLTKIVEKQLAKRAAKEKATYGKMFG